MYKDKELRGLSKSPALFVYSQELTCLKLTGQWNWQNIDESYIKKITPEIHHTLPANITIDAKEIEDFDTIGASFIKNLIDDLKQENIQSELLLNEKYQSLYLLVEKKISNKTEEKIERLNPITTAYYIGQRTYRYAKDFLNLVGFLGELTLSTFQWIKVPIRTKFKLVSEIVYNDGYKAVGIVCLLCFLIGIVLTYQMGGQLTTYGASIFIVNLLGLSLLREFAPLITAIIVAGRSGSAFAAQIGTMKVQEEIDALKTMGFSPVKRLVSPRVFGLIIGLTLLTVLADIASVFGGMVMSNTYLHIGFGEFLTRFQEVIAVKHFVLGLIKAPVFAILIAIVGCYRGFCVQGSADSIGRETTRSVVLSIFLIITADAAFSILYSSLGI